MSTICFWSLAAVLESFLDIFICNIEHNPDIIKSADYIIDLGPGGGEEGGQLIAQGTPEQVAQTPGSITGLYLKEKYFHSLRKAKVS